MPRAAVLRAAKAHAQRADIRQAPGSLLAEAFPQTQEDVRADRRVVAGAVVVELGQAEGMGHVVQPEASQLLHGALCHGQGVDRDGIESQAAAPRRGSDEADVKGGVMGGQREVSAELQEPLHRLGLGRGSEYVAVGDAGELHHVRRNGHLRVHEGLEGPRDPAVHDPDRADLGDAVVLGVQTRGLDVEADKIRVQRAVRLAEEGGHVVRIVDVVALKAVDDLYAVLVGRVPEIRERLRHAVVRDGDGLVAPAGRGLYGRRGVGQRVQRRIAGVQVELHALFARGVVLAQERRLESDGGGLYGDVAVVAVEGHIAPDRQPVPDPDFLQDRPVVVGTEVF